MRGAQPGAQERMSGALVRSAQRLGSALSGSRQLHATVGAQGYALLLSKFAWAGTERDGKRHRQYVVPPL